MMMIPMLKKAAFDALYKDRRSAMLTTMTARLLYVPLNTLSLMLGRHDRIMLEIT